MMVNGVNGMSGPTGPSDKMQATDSVSKNIKEQISNAQKQLQELSSNKEISMEEKMKKRQEIQKKIADLNSQLRQHQIDKRKESQQEKGTSADDMTGGTRNGRTKKNGSQGSGFSQEGMQAMISAEAAMNQAKIQESVAADNKGRANILKAEIKQDGAIGGNTAAKEAELAEAEQMAMQATASQMNTLAEVNKEIEEGAKEEPSEEAADIKEAEKTGKKESEETSLQNAGAASNQLAGGYTTVDIRL